MIQKGFGFVRTLSLLVELPIARKSRDSPSLPLQSLKKYNCFVPCLKVPFLHKILFLLSQKIYSFEPQSSIHLLISYSSKIMPARCSDKIIWFTKKMELHCSCISGHTTLSKYFWIARKMYHSNILCKQVSFDANSLKRN